jgi:hypothetical protein
VVHVTPRVTLPFNVGFVHASFFPVTPPLFNIASTSSADP